MNKKDRELQEMIDLLQDLDPVTILGLAKICNVSLAAHESATPKARPLPKPGERIIKELIVAFGNLGRRPRHELVAAMRQVAADNRKRGLSPRLAQQEAANGTKTND